jgi:hypothetical protein
MEIEIRLLKISEIDFVNDLYNTVYKKSRSKAEFEWEFISGPAGKAIYIVAVDTEKTGNPIIGTQAAIPLKMQNHLCQEILTAKSEDTLLDPNYRGKKIFDKMYQLLFSACKDAGIEVIWGFTYAKKPFEKLGFEIPFDSLQGIMPLETIKSASYLSSLNEANGAWDKFKVYGFVLYSKLKAFKFFTKNNSSIFVFKQTSFLDKNSLFESINNTDFLLQNSEYNNWRITTNPFKNDYVEYSLFLNNKVVANAIINYRSAGFAYIEQLIFEGNLNENEQLFFIQQLIKIIKNKGAFLIRYWGFENNETSINLNKQLAACGFTFIKKGTGFVWKNLNENKRISYQQLFLSRMFTQGNY